MTMSEVTAAVVQAQDIDGVTATQEPPMVLQCEVMPVRTKTIIPCQLISVIG